MLPIRLGNLRVARISLGFPVALESAMQDDALRDRRPNSPLIYARHNAPFVRPVFREIKSFPRSNNARPRLNARRHVPRVICVPTRSIGTIHVNTIFVPPREREKRSRYGVSPSYVFTESITLSLLLRFASHTEKMLHLGGFTTVFSGPGNY